MKVTLCGNCSSAKVVKNGVIAKKQRYKCKPCGYNFTVPRKGQDFLKAKKESLFMLIFLHGNSKREIAAYYNVSHTYVNKAIANKGGNRLCKETIMQLHKANGQKVFHVEKLAGYECQNVYSMDRLIKEYLQFYFKETENNPFNPINESLLKEPII